MDVILKLVGEAALEWERSGKPAPTAQAHVEAFGIQRGDFVTHPLFPERAMQCMARHINLVTREVELFLDFAEEHDGPGTAH